jgi:hypothetical protein
MNVTYQGASLRVPDFLIVGAARSGTTSLYSFLDRHPGIYMPREKEPTFFSVYRQDRSPLHVRRGPKADYAVQDLADYLRLFRPARNGQLIGEASTRYLYRYPTTIANIREIYGENSRDLRIIILLRNPAERAWSHYWMKRRNGDENLSFEEAIRSEVVRERQERRCTPGFDYIGFGKYFRQVESYLRHFPHVKILLFEDMIENQSQVKRDICGFLGVEPVPFGPEEKKLNVSGTPKNKLAGVVANFVYRPSRLKSFLKVLAPYKMRAGLKYRLAGRIFRPERMEDALKNRVAEAFRDDVLDLARLIDRDLSRWLPSAPEGTS